MLNEEDIRPFDEVIFIGYHSKSESGHRQMGKRVGERFQVINVKKEWVYVILPTELHDIGDPDDELDEISGETDGFYYPFYYDEIELTRSGICGNCLSKCNITDRTECPFKEVKKEEEISSVKI